MVVLWVARRTRSLASAGAVGREWHRAVVVSCASVPV